MVAALAVFGPDVETRIAHLTIITRGTPMEVRRGEVDIIEQALVARAAEQGQDAAGFAEADVA